MPRVQDAPWGRGSPALSQPWSPPWRYQQDQLPPGMRSPITISWPNSGGPPAPARPPGSPPPVVNSGTTGGNTTATTSGGTTPNTTTAPQQPPQWWSDPKLLQEFLEQLGGGLPQVPPGTDPDELNNIRADQARGLIDDLNRQYANERSSLAGWLGGHNIQNSGLAAGTMDEANRNAYLARGRVATDLAGVLAQANLDYNRYLGDYGLNRFNSIGNLALGFGQLGLNSQTQLGQLQLRQQEIDNQKEQFYASQAFTANQAAIDRAFQMGVLDRQYGFQGQQSDLQRQHEIELQKLGATNQREAIELQQAFQAGQNAADRAQQTAILSQQQAFQGGQAEADRAQQAAMLQAQQGFQGQQAELERAQARELQNNQLAQQLQITLAQLQETAAGRVMQNQQETARLGLAATELAAQIAQNQFANQLALQQFGQSGQQQQFGNAVQLLGLTQKGLDPSNPMVAGLFDQVGLPPTGGRSFPQGVARAGQPTGPESFATGSRAELTGPNPMGSAAADRARAAQEAWYAYQQSQQPPPLWGMPQQTWGDVAALGQLQNQAQGQQMDYSLGMARIGAMMGQGQTPAGKMSPAATNSYVASLPPTAQQIYRSITTGERLPSTIQQNELRYWTQQLEKLYTGGGSNLDAQKDWNDKLFDWRTAMSSRRKKPFVR